MKSHGITLVSLVVTIIILIILAGVSLHLTLGENGIIRMAKKAKENMELAQIEEERTLNELYTQLQVQEGNEGDLTYDAIAKLNEFKKQIANSIEEAGGMKPEDTADAPTFRKHINEIVKEVTKDATATAEDIKEGKTAWVNGSKITGTMPKPNLDGIEIEVLHHHGLSHSASNAGRETDWGTTIHTENFKTMNVNLTMSASFYSYVNDRSYTDVDVILHIYAYTSDTDYVDLYGEKSSTLNQTYDISAYRSIRFYIKFDENASDYKIHSSYGIQLNYSNVTGTLKFS